MDLGPLRQSWATPACAYCGCCRTERPAHEVEAGLCMDCYDVCWSGECKLDTSTGKGDG